MPAIRVALMGFGRIGRNLFRILYDRNDIRVAAISDVADHRSLEYLLRFDTILGRFPEAVETAREALALVTQQDKQALADDLRAKLVLYEAEKPFRQLITPIFIH